LQHQGMLSPAFLNLKRKGNMWIFIIIFIAILVVNPDLILLIAVGIYWSFLAALVLAGVASIIFAISLLIGAF
jgi:hypothetical protein